MGRTSGVEYCSLTGDEDDCTDDYPSVSNHPNSSFSAVSLRDAGDGPAAVEMGSEMMEDPACEVTDNGGDYWSQQKGLSWFLVLIVRFLFIGKRSAIVLVAFNAVCIVLFVTAVMIYPIKLETSLSSFQIPDHPVYLREDAFETATGTALSAQNTQFAHPSGRRRRDTYPNINRGGYYPDNIISKFNERNWEKYKINLVYRTVDGSNILQKKYIERIHQIERIIENHTDYTKFCWLDWSRGSLLGHQYPNPVSDCYPLNSLMTYFYPPTGRSNEMAFGGDIMTIIRNAWSSPDFFWYLDSTFSDKEPVSKLMRSQIILGYPLHGSMSGEDQHQAAKKYIVDFIPLLASLSNDEIHVLYGSADIYDYQVLEAAYSDIRLSIISVCVIAMFVFILTSFSPFLTFICLLSVAMSLPLAYFIYRVFAGVDTFGLLNILSLFVLTGIGVDDGFMFINTFRQAPSWSHASVDIRLHYTLYTAGKATLFTSATTAAAFFANLASGIPAVHNFGLFMGLVVVMCYLTVAAQMPAALYIWQTYICCRTPCCAGLQSRLCTSKCCFESAEGVEGEDQSIELTSVRTVDSTTSDAALLSARRSVSGISQQSSASSTGSTPRSTWTLTNTMAKFIRRFIAKPVIKIRGVIIVLFIILFATSLGLVTRLRTAQKPPQFFPSDSNLQQFIDLGYNTSQINVDCSRCSGYFHPFSNPNVAPSIATLLTTRRSPNPTRAPTTRRPTKQTLAPTATTQRKPTRQPGIPTETPPREPTTRRGATTAPGEVPETVPAPQTQPPVSVTHPPGPTRGPAPSQPLPPIQTVTRAPVTVQTENKCGAAGSCVAHKPSLTNTANIYIVFGIKTLVRSDTNGTEHVITTSDKDTVIYDARFADAFAVTHINQAALETLCKICVAALEPHRGLVLTKDGSWECVPAKLLTFLPTGGSGACANPKLLAAGDAVHAQVGMNSTNVNWLAMGFKSKVYQGGSSFTARDEYGKWEAFMKEVHRNFTDPAVQSAYQTSEYWKQIFLEVVAVTSALYSIALSALLCLIFVGIFTGCPLLTSVTLATVGCIACFVLACFYLLGWHLGAVEAISMSILIGTAVDYCVHLVQGYIVASRHLKAAPISKSQPWISRARAHIAQSCQRALWSLSHVGLSIVSSALTTLFASLPLCFAEIQLLARFGQIMFINTAVSILLTATACCALLCFQPQWRFPGTWKASAGGLLVTGVICGLIFLSLYLIHIGTGLSIPAPDGSNLF